jgi:hypothetical protein
MNLLSLPRRDQCDLVGRRAQKLDPEQAARAWQLLGQMVEAMANAMCQNTRT